MAETADQGEQACPYLFLQNDGDKRLPNQGSFQQMEIISRIFY